MNFKEWLELEAADLMTGFKGWYNYSRGDWAQVEAAARKDPAVRNLLIRIQANLSDLSKSGPWGDQLEAAVERSFPEHSKRKARDRWEKERFAAMGLKTADQSGQPSPTRTAVPGAADGDDGFQLRRDPSHKQPNPAQDDTQLSNIVTDHERRLRNLEIFLKGGQNKPHTVGAMDATASYSH